MFTGTDWNLAISPAASMPLITGIRDVSDDEIGVFRSAKQGLKS